MYLCTSVPQLKHKHTFLFIDELPATILYYLATLLNNAILLQTLYARARSIVILIKDFHHIVYSKLFRESVITLYGSKFVATIGGSIAQFIIKVLFCKRAKEMTLTGKLDVDYKLCKLVVNLVSFKLTTPVLTLLMKIVLP